jgi:hypothetical protein
MAFQLFDAVPSLTCNTRRAVWLLSIVACDSHQSSNMAVATCNPQVESKVKYELDVLRHSCA